MKKLILAVTLAMILCGMASGAQIFTTTIRNTTIRQVQDVSLEYMMSRNFAIARVEAHTLTFTKGFGDGIWIIQRNMIVKFNMLERDGNVKLMVTQFEDSPQAYIKGQRAIEHLAPLIQDIRHAIDGTPLEQIVNEVTDQQPGAKGKAAKKAEAKASGLAFDGVKISGVEPGSLADKAGFKEGDVLVEINGKPASAKNLEDIDARLAAKRSVIITYERDGKKGVITLK